MTRSTLIQQLAKQYVNKLIDDIFAEREEKEEPKVEFKEETTWVDRTMDRLHDQVRERGSHFPPEEENQGPDLIEQRLYEEEMKVQAVTHVLQRDIDGYKVMQQIVNDSRNVGHLTVLPPGMGLKDIPIVLNAAASHIHTYSGRCLKNSYAPRCS